MTKIKDVDPDAHLELDAEMQQALGDLVDEFATKHRYSALSITTLALQCLADGLEALGGPASHAYLRCLAERLTVTNERDAKKLNDRARRAMEKMAEHYDAKRKAFAERTLQ